MKRINPRLAKLHRSYSVTELAKVLGVHKRTVREWIKKGLPLVDGAKPALILGSEFQAWWGNQRKAKKRPCKPGQMYCLKCRAPKAPALAMVEYAATNAATGNLKALCETCGTLMHQRIRLSRIPARMPGMDVQITQAPSSIVELAHPSLNCAKKKDY
ncbi:MAG: helix-turn-helix domain-containing protein [Pseudomonadota bacterium]